MRQTLLPGLGTREQRLCFETHSGAPAEGPKATPVPPVPETVEFQGGFEKLRKEVMDVDTKPKLDALRSSFEQRLSTLRDSIDPRQLQQLLDSLQQKREELETTVETSIDAARTEVLHAVDAMKTIVQQSWESRNKVFQILSQQGERGDVLRAAEGAQGFSILGFTFPKLKDTGGFKYLRRYLYEGLVGLQKFLPDWARGFLSSKIEEAPAVLSEMGAQDGLRAAVAEYQKTSGKQLHVVWDAAVWDDWKADFQSQDRKIDTHLTAQQAMQQHVRTRIPEALKDVKEEDWKKGPVTIAMALIPSPERRVAVVPSTGPTSPASADVIPEGMSRDKEMEVTPGKIVPVTVGGIVYRITRGVVRVGDDKRYTLAVSGKAPDGSMGSIPDNQVQMLLKAPQAGSLNETTIIYRVAGSGFADDITMKLSEVPTTPERVSASNANLKMTITKATTT